MRIVVKTHPNKTGTIKPWLDTQTKLESCLTNRIRMNEWVLIATCKQLVWSTRIGRNMPIWNLDVEPEPRNVRIPGRIFGMWLGGHVTCTLPWDKSWSRRGWMGGFFSVVVELNYCNNSKRKRKKEKEKGGGGNWAWRARHKLSEARSISPHLNPPFLYRFGGLKISTTIKQEPLRT